MRLVGALAGQLRRRVAVEPLDEHATVRVPELRRDVLGVQVQNGPSRGMRLLVVMARNEVA